MFGIGAVGSLLGQNLYANILSQLVAEKIWIDIHVHRKDFLPSSDNTVAEAMLLSHLLCYSGV